MSVQPETAILLAVMVVFLLTLIRWHTSTKSRLNLQYLFLDTETKMFSIFKFGQVLALFVSTWVLIRETNHDRLSEWLFGAYMIAWAGANIANRVINKPTEPKP